MKLTIETEHIEFKLSTSQLNRAIESLGAMLNKHGKGKVLFGVQDDGTIVGQNIVNKTLKDISESINSKIKPTVIPHIEILNMDDRIVISVEVTGFNKPYSANGLYLIRSGSENKKIEPEQMKDLLFTNSVETITNIESFNQDLTFSQLKQLYIIKGLTIDNDTFYKNMGLLCKNGKFNVLGEILSDNNNCSIKVVRFNGIDKSEIIFRNEYGYKCLLLSMQQALEYVYSLNETKVQVDESFQRKEVKLFDEKCLKEAWSNACLHSKWSTMIPPVIYIFADRIEVVSTGGLPLDYPLEDFFIGVSHPINKQLQKIMGQLGIVEQTGHGVPEIVKKYGKEAFEITSNHITVKLKFPFNISSKSMDFDGLSESHKKVLKSIANQPSITIKEICKVVGLKTTRVNDIIKDLRTQGKLDRIGSNKNGYWKVIK